MPVILQDSLPFAPWMQAATARLPGIQPIAMADWVQVDEAYGAQLDEKARLLAQQREAVLAEAPDAHAASGELLALVLEQLGRRNDFDVVGDHVVRPDGVSTLVNRDTPLETLASLVQEDVAILMKDGDEHVLRAALICFPASWSLAEKIGRPLAAIHAPVDSYAPQMARRVQRLFDASRAGKPLMRANALRYVDPELFQPRRFGDAKPIEPGAPAFMRSERQTILRLPKTGAVVFTIHTYVVAWGDLTDAQRAGWQASG